MGGASKPFLQLLPEAPTQTLGVCIAQPGQVRMASGGSPAKMIVGPPVAKADVTKPAPTEASQKLNKATEGALKDIQVPAKNIASSEPACCFNFMGKLAEMASPKTSKAEEL